jgi:hypothetical protein
LPPPVSSISTKGLSGSGSGTTGSANGLNPYLSK